MKIYKALVSLDTDDGNIYQAEVIEYQSRLWLVCGWSEAPSEGYKIPARIVSLDCLKHKKTSGSSHFDFELLQVPKNIWDLEKEINAEYSSITRPDIRVSIPKGIH